MVTFTDTIFIYTAFVNRGHLKNALFEKIPIYKNFNKELLSKPTGDEDIDEIPTNNSKNGRYKIKSYLY